MKKLARRVNLTVNREMMVALEILAGKSGLPITTQAMVVLRQGLDRTITSEPAQLRLRQDQAFRTRDEWLRDQADDTYVTNAVRTFEGVAEDAPPV